MSTREANSRQILQIYTKNAACLAPYLNQPKAYSAICIPQRHQKLTRVAWFQHYTITILITYHRLTSEMLERICNNEDVLEVAGEYTGGIRGCGASQSIESIGIVINSMNMITLPHNNNNYKYAMVILIDQNRVVLKAFRKYRQSFAAKTRKDLK